VDSEWVGTLRFGGCYNDIFEDFDAVSVRCRVRLKRHNCADSPTSKPVARQSAPAAKSADPAKQAVSKACSDDLHGKPRKAFRSQCKKNGGKAA
jgi:hypothetical protein